jgi:hypothetical protein
MAWYTRPGLAAGSSQRRGDAPKRTRRGDGERQRIDIGFSLLDVGLPCLALAICRDQRSDRQLSPA